MGMSRINRVIRALETLRNSTPFFDQDKILIDPCEEYILVYLPSPVDADNASKLRELGWFAWTESRADTETLVWAFDSSKE